jgi:hypothetical protein
MFHNYFILKIYEELENPLPHINIKSLFCTFLFFPFLMSFHFSQKSYCPSVSKICISLYTSPILLHFHSTLLYFNPQKKTVLFIVKITSKFRPMIGIRPTKVFELDFGTYFFFPSSAFKWVFLFYQDGFRNCSLQMWVTSE